MLSLEQLAVKFGRSTERYKRLLRLSFLSPKIMDAIIAGKQPAQLTNRFLQNLDGLPLSWAEQELLLLGEPRAAFRNSRHRNCTKEKKAWNCRDLWSRNSLSEKVRTYVYVIWRKSAKTATS